MNIEVQYWINYLNSLSELRKTYNFMDDKESIEHINSQKFTIIFHIVHTLHPELVGGQLASVVNTIEHQWKQNLDILSKIDECVRTIKAIER